MYDKARHNTDEAVDGAAGNRVVAGVEPGAKPPGVGVRLGRRASSGL